MNLPEFDHAQPAASTRFDKVLTRFDQRSGAEGSGGAHISARPWPSPHAGRIAANCSGRSSLKANVQSSGSTPSRICERKKTKKDAESGQCPGGEATVGGTVWTVVGRAGCAESGHRSPYRPPYGSPPHPRARADCAANSHRGMKGRESDSTVGKRVGATLGQGGGGG